MAAVDGRIHLLLAVEGMLLDLKNIAHDRTVSGDAMGLYLLDLVLEKCRAVLWQLQSDD